MNIGRDASFAKIESGTVVPFTVDIGNTGSGNCNLVGVTVTVYCPQLDGKPGGTGIVLASGLDLPFPTPSFNIGSVPCKVTTSSTVPSAQARVVVTGESGSCQLSGVDTADGSATATVAVFHTAVRITKTCGCTEYGKDIAFSGIVFNDSDQDVTITDLSDVPSGTITPGAGTIIPAGGSVPYSGFYPNPIGCGPFADTVTVTAVGTQVNTEVKASATASCPIKSTPSIQIAKDCYKKNPDGSKDGKLLDPGDSYYESFTVTNDGDVPLDNVEVTDNNPITGSMTYKKASLDPGEVWTFEVGPIPTAPTDCGKKFTDSATVTANNRCPDLLPVDCPNPPTKSAGPATCTVEVKPCPPCVTITKEVACAPAGVNGAPPVCDGTLTYNEEAHGVADSSTPAFCYKITITNPATTAGFETCLDSLKDIVVTDPDLSALPLAGFPTTLAPKESATAYFIKNWGVEPSYPAKHVNTATVEGIGANSGIKVTASDPATVTIGKLDIKCVDPKVVSTFDMDNTEDASATLPKSGPVEVTVTFQNAGTETLTITKINGIPAGAYNCVTMQPVTADDLLPATPLAPGAGFGVNFCVDVTCPDGLTLKITAEAEVYAAEPGDICDYDSNGKKITDISNSCDLVVKCQPPVTCRVTGGGVLMPGEEQVSSCDGITKTTVSGPKCNNVEAAKVTHGGQLGAPFSQEDCGQDLGNPCIRGQWEHVRHYQGKANPQSSVEVDNFHSNTPKGIFDTLLCACLPCCENPDPTGIIKNDLCNPDDHKICGPQPRPAPANAIIFTGVGRLSTCDSSNGKGQGDLKWVLFRVYIEDRSEPGGSHPGGAKKPADVYSFQAWSITGTDYNSDANQAARKALATDSCNFVKTYKQGSLPNANVLGAPLINDSGTLHTGNHQIHPSTSATCP